MVLKLLKENPSLTASKMAELINKNSRTIQRITNDLKNKKLIERIGGTRGYWKVIDEAFHIEEEIERFSSDYLIDRQTYWDGENAYYPLEDEEDGGEEMPADGASNERLHNYLIQAVHEQMSNLDYVKKTYDRLLKSYSEKEAIDKIAAVLLTEIYNIEKEKREFNEEQYIKELSKLK